MLPAETPKLPKWPFLLGDAVLLGTAWLIADQASNPFSGQPLIWIVVCVLAAAILGAAPFLADYARKQDEALDERQRSLEAISRTVAASAEQISIAANGLHELTELAQRNLKAAGQLGPGLEEKVAALKAELTATRDDERATLRKEVAALRAAETGRVEAAAQQLAKTAAEILRAESALQKQISAAGDLAAALAAARATAPAAPAEPAPEAAAETPAEKPEHRRSRKSPPPVESVETPPPVPVEPTATAPAPTPPPAETSPVTEPTPVPAAAEPAITPEPAPATAPTAAPADIAPESPAPVRKRAPRKPRAEPAAEPALEIPVATPEAAPVTETPAIVADLKSEISDFSSVPAPVTDETPPPADSDEPTKSVEQSRSSDGATRLLVTAYIGIGNRLFIRGEGPGLGWDKGLPLQFVSIGKWRWESPDATGPVKYKLYKNDSVECTALGAQQVDPGQQQEVTAAF